MHTPKDYAVSSVSQRIKILLALLSNKLKNYHKTDFLPIIQPLISKMLVKTLNHWWAWKWSCLQKEV